MPKAKSDLHRDLSTYIDHQVSEVKAAREHAGNMVKHCRFSEAERDMLRAETLESNVHTLKFLIAENPKIDDPG